MDQHTTIREYLDRWGFYWSQGRISYTKHLENYTKHTENDTKEYGIILPSDSILDESVSRLNNTRIKILADDYIAYYSFDFTSKTPYIEKAFKDIERFINETD